MNAQTGSLYTETLLGKSNRGPEDGCIIKNTTTLPLLLRYALTSSQNTWV